MNDVGIMAESGDEGRGDRVEIATPIETSQGNITEQVRSPEATTWAGEPVGLGIMSDGIFSEGLQVVVNLANRTLTEAENSLLSKGLLFALHQPE